MLCFLLAPLSAEGQNTKSEDVIMRRFAVSVGILLLILTGHSSADVHYVSTNGSGIIPYTNWTDAATNIQAAVDAAGDGDTVVIGDGTYYVAPTDGVTWNATNKHIRVSSQNGAQNCIIDCQSKGRGFTFTSGQTTNDVIDGFTIKNGASQWAYGTSSDLYGGGGIFIQNSSPYIKNCTITNCTAKKSPYATIYADGGGIDVINSSPMIENCIVTGNKATHTGGGIHNWGSSPTIRNCIITRNFNGGCYGGGGLSFSYNSSGLVQNNLICSNSANYYTTKGGFGGGIELANSNPTIEGNTIVFNDTRLNGVPGEGGGLRIRGLPTPIVRNNILQGNISTNGLEDLDFQYPTWTLDMNHTLVGSGSTNFICSDMGSNIWGSNPQFVDAASGNFHLQESSPCIDKGTNLTDIVTDLDGNPRPTDGDYDGIATHDMGCYEFVPPQVSIVVNAGTNGTVVPSGTISVTKGAGTNFWIYANLDYHVSGIVTNGASIGGTFAAASTNYFWNRIMTSGTLDAVFDLNRTVNGIPHIWLTQHGITNKSDSVETDNSDSDSYNNLQEYVAGTDPTNSESHLRFNMEIGRAHV
jgi:hypothetical protein